MQTRSDLLVNLRSSVFPFLDCTDRKKSYQLNYTEQTMKAMEYPLAYLDIRGDKIALYNIIHPFVRPNYLVFDGSSLNINKHLFYPGLMV